MEAPEGLQHLEFLLDGVAVINREGVIQYANSPFSAFLNISARRLQKQNIKDVLKLTRDEWADFGDLTALQEPTSYHRCPYVIGDVEGELGVSIIPLEGKDDLLMLVCRDLSLEKSLHAKYQQSMLQKESIFKAHQRKLFEVLFLQSMSEVANEVQTADQLFEEFLPKIIDIADLYSVGFLIAGENNDFQMKGLSSKDKITNRVLRNLIDEWKVDIHEALTSKKSVIKEGSEYNALIIPVFFAQDMAGVFLAIQDKSRAMDDGQTQMVITMAQQMAVHWERIRLRSDVMIDPLTQVYNKRYFEMKLELDLKNSNKLNSPLTLIMLDIDHFKRFNDTYGHQTGDHVLTEVVKIVKKNLRSYDTCARYGGEEFVLVLPDTPLQAAVQIAERMRIAIERHIVDKNRPEIQVTSSFGVACAPQHAREKTTLIEKADQALYKSKNRGRNRVTVA